MSVDSIVAGCLSDRRIQLFANKDFAIWTCWKASADPDSEWTAWSKFTSGDFSAYGEYAAGAAATRPDNTLELFVLDGTPVGLPSIGGPSLLSTNKTSTDVDSDWAPVLEFYPATYGPPGYTATGVVSVTAAPLSDNRLQVFLSEHSVGGSAAVPSKIMTAWEKSTDPGAGWTGFEMLSPQPPEPLGSLATATLPDRRLQLFGIGGGGMWSTWKTAGANSGWSGWSKFQPLPLGLSAGGLISANLPDNRPQLWTIASDGTVYTCWKADANPDAPWTAWEKFQEMNIRSMTVAPLTDGRLQIWGVDPKGNLLSTWKQSSDPNAGWEAWSAFPAP